MWKSFFEFSCRNKRQIQWSLGKQTQRSVLNGAGFWEILICRRTACPTSEDSLLSTSFTGYPAAVTLYEVQLQLLLLLTPKAQLSKAMQEFKVGCFPVWPILPSGGRGHQSRLSWGTKPVKAGSFFCWFVFIYLYFLLFPHFLSPSCLFWLLLLGFCKVPRASKRNKNHPSGMLHSHLWAQASGRESV